MSNFASFVVMDDLNCSLDKSRITWGVSLGNYILFKLLRFPNRFSLLSSVMALFSNVLMIFKINFA